MRKLVSGLFYSLDGVAEAPDQWQFAFDDEMGAALSRTIESTDAVMMGRVTFTDWAGYWPNVTEGEDLDFANWINNAPKYVASTTLTDVSAWQNSTLLGSDLAAEVARLKAGEGKDIAVTGSIGLVRSLVEQDLLDVLELYIHPVVAGGGRKKLFADDASLKKLQLVDSYATSSGVVAATYHPVR
ncbi:dihydrofolate reductase family protein [Streptomyces sp. 4N509B]|uniref:dihydrofolate reductase family protein n=1 Tax=Streptomyces sp. 4N509B TaxID=3457413 RepID=UPI003FD00C43